MLAGCTPAPPSTAPVPPATAAPAPAAPSGQVTIPWSTVRGTDTGGFDITLRFSATLSADQVDPVIAAFNSAAATWEQVITADLAPVTLNGFNGCWGSGATSTIDDVTIDVTISAVDGPGGVLGSAGFCRSQGTIARAGAMRFDSADLTTMLQRGNFDRVILHEMGHVLGIGTMWPYTGLLSGQANPNPAPTCDPNDPSYDPRFTGAHATAEWNALSNRNDSGVPVEACGGAGTAMAHWRESTFRSELMTGWINIGASPLSRVSLASLADLGYTVDMTKADPYLLGPSILDLIPGTATDLHDHDGEFVLFGPDGPIGID